MRGFVSEENAAIAAGTPALGALGTTIKPFATRCAQQVRDKMDENESERGLLQGGGCRNEGGRRQTCWVECIRGYVNASAAACQPFGSAV